MKSVKFQGDMLNFCDFFQVFVFTTNHHLNCFGIIIDLEANDQKLIQSTILILINPSALINAPCLFSKT